MSLSSDNYWLASSEQAFVVTPSDSTDLAFKGANTTSTKRLYAAGAGTITMVLAGQKQSEAFVMTVIAGAMLPLSVKRVMATGTTATGIVAFY